MKNLPFLFVLLLIPGILYAQAVFITPEEAFRVIFPGAVMVPDKKSLSDEQKKGLKVSKKDWDFKIAKAGGKIIGYALIDNEIGKTEPITFLTAITPQGTVKEVEILIYREAYGGAVHAKGFLNQYQGKTVQDPLQLGKDIQNITGATLSSRAVTRGVKRAIALWELFYDKK